MHSSPSSHRTFWLVVALTLGLAGSVLSPAVAQPWREDPVQVLTLSNRADLISGGDALVEVVLPDRADPSEVAVSAGDRDVTDLFAVRDDGRFTGLIEGLDVGVTRVTATLPDGSGAHLDVTNHPAAGPIFSGPQIQPWYCLPDALDAQCTREVSYTYYYKPASDATDGATGRPDAPVGPFSSRFPTYNPDNPPPATLIAEATTDQGVTVPYIVRVETGTLNRSQYQIAVLAEPGQEFTHATPPPAWNGKVNVTHGFGCGMGHSEGQAPPVLYDDALSRGFVMMSHALEHNTENCNLVPQAESVMMVKERIIEQYGDIRFLFGIGASGGSIAQNRMANAYPGLYDGIIVASTYPDMPILDVGDCVLLEQYWESTTTLWTEAHKAAASGRPSSVCVAWHRIAPLTPILDPTVGNECDVTAQEPELVYDPESNPTGVRCSYQDFMVNIYGERPPERWGEIEESIGRGFANRPYDNVGVQYGLRALLDGSISPAQFVDLNTQLGGLDIDAQPQVPRIEADPDALARAYRSSDLNQANHLDQVPIIDIPLPADRYEIHDNYKSWALRERLVNANGHADNHVIWNGCDVLFTFDCPNGIDPFDVMDEWLTAIEADASDASIEQKIVDNKPADAQDYCLIPEAQLCAAVMGPAASPRWASGGALATDVIQCQLMPLDRADYEPVEFTDEQWAQLEAALPSGVCDWTKPGVDQQHGLKWLTYADGPDGVPLGDPPVSVPFGPEGASLLVTRHGGPTRIETAVAVSALGVESADTVVIARADDFADALAGGPLATHLEAPLLLTPRASLGDSTAAEIQRLGATQAVLLGGEAALSAQVATDLADLGLAVRRIDGPNRFATAAAIAAEMPASGEALVTRGDAFPDALAASGLGAAAGVPILLVDPARLPSETIAALTGDLDVTIVGGTVAVTQDVADQIDGIVSTVDRLAGATRYATSAAVADAALTRGVSPAITWVATGSDFPDALVAAAGAGRDQAILLLIDGDDLDVSAETRGWLAANRVAITEIRIAGGQAAVSATVETGLRGI